MRLEIRLPFEVIALFAEKQMLAQLARMSAADDPSMVQVIPKNKLNAGLKGDRLQLAVQVDVAGNGIAGIMPALFRLLDGGEKSRPLVRLEVSISANWSITPKWMWQPDLRADHRLMSSSAGKTALPGAMGGIAEPWIVSGLEEVVKEISEQIKGNSLLRSAIEPAWDALGHAFHVLDKPEIWVVIQPSGAALQYVTQLDAAAGMKLLLGDAIRFKVGIGRIPAPLVHPLPEGMPVRDLLSDPAQVEVEVAYQTLDELARGAVIPLPGPLPHLQIAEVTAVEGNGKKAVFRVRLTETKKPQNRWEVLLSISVGTPVSDGLPRFVIDAIDLVQSPGWVRVVFKAFSKTIRKNIRQVADAWIASQWKEIRQVVSDSLSGLEIYKGVLLQAKLGQIKSLDMHFEFTYLTWNLSVEEETSILVQEIPEG